MRVQAQSRGMSNVLNVESVAKQLIRTRMNLKRGANLLPGGYMSTNNIQHVFVLMLENRSFDHMLGYSGITGTDAESGRPTKVHGLEGTESIIYNGTTYSVKQIG